MWSETRESGIHLEKTIATPYFFSLDKIVGCKYSIIGRNASN
jgi:hypothetical protein